MQVWFWRCLFVAIVVVAPILSGRASAQQEGGLLHDIRREIGAVFADEEVCDRYVERFDRAGSSGSALLLGYHGAVRMARGRHAFDPLSRLVHFNGGKSMLEKAIAQDVNNAELRFLRLSIQVNVPSIVGYDANKAEDLALVERKLKDVKDPALKDRITRFITTNRENGKL
ncbi:MAG: hypothetical protein IPJ87_07865 [Flavobacteriales bacterium]|nr:hypothetical protein [Flavobacteriales bacterium]MBK7941776.1 hypothetical protein [Flavobacteriales bacterium]MBK8949776.1 hypothetical protein [Flavobacteriales bacterium]MBK9700318.1 hypothetical protein [Flavobacteriales bacterium]